MYKQIKSIGKLFLNLGTFFRNSTEVLEFSKIPFIKLMFGHQINYYAEKIILKNFTMGHLKEKKRNCKYAD